MKRSKRNLESFHDSLKYADERISSLPKIAEVNALDYISILLGDNHPPKLQSRYVREAIPVSSSTSNSNNTIQFIVQLNESVMLFWAQNISVVMNSTDKGNNNTFQLFPNNTEFSSGASSDNHTESYFEISTTALQGDTMWLKFVFINGTSKSNLTANSSVIPDYWSMMIVLSLGTNKTTSIPFYPNKALTVPYGFSYHCTPTRIFSPPSNSSYMGMIVISGLQVQPFEVANATTEGVYSFSTSDDCVGYYTYDIWMGILTSLIILCMLYCAVMGLMSISTSDRFDDPQGKPLMVEESRNMATRKHNVDTATSSAKRTKVDPTNGASSPSSSLDYTWEWRESGTDEWSAYSSGEQERISEAFVKDKQFKLESLSKDTLFLDFQNMTHSTESSTDKFEFRCRYNDLTYNDRWQWKEDSGIWKDYADEEKRRIESAQTLELYTIQIILGSAIYEIDFSKHLQTNLKSKCRRSIRKYDAEKDPVVAKPKWQWKDDTGKWKDFSDELNEEIDNEYQASKSKFSFKIGANNYNLDFVTRLQVNIVTGISRQVRRNEPKTGTSTKANAPLKSDPISNKQKFESEAEPVPTSSTAEEEPKSKTTEKSVKFTGKSILHPSLSSLKGAEIYSEGEDVYDVMLNQTNLKNNNNKFYTIQLIQSLSGTQKHFSVFTRWGRVGLSGQCSTEGYGPDLQRAKGKFEQKFYDKTNNSWEDRDDFVKTPGKYDLLDMDYGEDEKDDLTKDIKNASDSDEEMEVGVESKLQKSLQSLIEFVSDVKAFETIMKEMKYDTKKAPLGKLTKLQIESGVIALKEIEKLIKKGKLGNELTEACNTFYTRIPHCFGMTRPPILSTDEDIKEKIALMEALGDIEIAVTLLKESNKTDVHPVDQHYLGLNCEMEPISRISDEFKLVEKYTLQTHGPTHSQYTMLILDIFKTSKSNQDNNFVDHGNRVLLWHGSRLTNWVGILSQGLRIAPPEAPTTGYMFGKGLYFADVSSKSANYCYATPSNNQGCLLLCEVSLGNTNNLLAADYDASDLPSGTHSTFASGKMVPDPAEEVTMDDGCKVPLGKIMKTSVTNPSGYTLNYNEYVVYNVNQVKFRYLLRVKFNFK
ncbi:Poly polymerase 2 [Oopsacas minuta]|uniref:Poly [ADP-ribose] polymerase n=1 Tax=Oopsacas minuta TaxID=111878 RepID=A0AAV7KJL9_9METZ|nr:Poly polymerase 2 [Oopsacas minuta]